MPLSVPPGTAHVGLQFRAQNDPDPWYITFGVESSNWGGDFIGLGRYVFECFWNNWVQAFPGTVEATGVQLTIGQDGTEDLRLFVAPAVGGRFGTSSAAMLPQNCALLVRKNTSLGGRRNRGRMFLPGCLDENKVTPTGLIDTNYRGILQEYADNFMEALANPVEEDENAAVMLLLHGSGNTATPPPTPVQTLQVDQVISTQRRRLR